MYPQPLVADVRKAMPRDGIITLDNGMYKIWFARNYHAYSPNTVLLDNDRVLNDEIKKQSDNVSP